MTIEKVAQVAREGKLPNHNSVGVWRPGLWRWLAVANAVTKAGDTWQARRTCDAAAVSLGNGMTAIVNSGPVVWYVAQIVDGHLCYAQVPQEALAE